MAEETDWTKKNFRKMSKNNWFSSEGPTSENINTGSLQRIADSLEKIEQPYLKLISEIKFYSDAYNRQGITIQKLLRKNAALRGVITKLKKKQ